MRKSFLFSLCILLCLAFSVSVFAQKGKPSSGCGPDVGVRVGIEPMAIVPDVAGKWYVNGQEGVEAIFQVTNCSQDFTMNLNTSKRFIGVNLDAPNTSKFFNFDRVASVPVTLDPAFNQLSGADFLNSQFCTASPESLGGFNVGKNPDGSYRDNYAGCGVDENGRGYVRRNVGFGLVASGKNQLGLRFQYSPLDGGVNAANVSGTAFVRVYHPTPARWELVPDNESNLTLGTSGTIPPIGVRLLNGADSGRFSVPFRIIVEM